MTREFIAHEARNDEAWICLCGNQPGSDGFYPCKAQGEELEPILGAGTKCAEVLCGGGDD